MWFWLFDFGNNLLNWIVDALSWYTGTKLTQSAALKILYGWIVSVFAATTPYIHKLLKRNSAFYRSFYDKREQICGFYIEEIRKNDTSYFTFLNIYYDKQDSDYKVQGMAYDENGEEHAIFSSFLISGSIISGHHIEFLYSGSYVKTSAPVRGYCIYNYNAGYRDGVGHIVDFEVDEDETIRQTLRLSFKFRLLSKKEIARTFKGLKYLKIRFLPSDFISKSIRQDIVLDYIRKKRRISLSATPPTLLADPPEGRNV